MPCKYFIVWKLSVGCFEWVENTPQVNKDFIKNYNDDTDKRYLIFIRKNENFKIWKICGQVAW